MQVVVGDVFAIGGLHDARRAQDWLPMPAPLPVATKFRATLFDKTHELIGHHSGLALDDIVTWLMKQPGGAVRCDVWDDTSPTGRPHATWERQAGAWRVTKGV